MSYWAVPPRRRASFCLLLKRLSGVGELAQIEITEAVPARAIKVQGLATGPLAARADRSVPGIDELGSSSTVAQPCPQCEQQSCPSPR